MGTVGQSYHQARPRPAAFGAEPPPPMLAGHVVSQAMINDVKAAKARGKRVCLATPGLSEDALPSDLCANCGGLGILLLQIIDFGPAPDHPGGTAGWHAGGWCRMDTKVYHCPKCGKARDIVL